MLKLCLFQDEEIKCAIEDAGFDAEVMPEVKKSQSMSQKTLTGQFRISGMTCAACVNSVEGILSKLIGVKRAVVALTTCLGEVEYNPSLISKEDIVLAIEDAGFDAEFLRSSEQDKTVLMVDGLFSVIDVHLLEGILMHLKGVNQFNVNVENREVEVTFDTEVLGLRSIVDFIEKESGEKLKVHAQSPYSRRASGDEEEASKMFRVFMRSLLLSVSIILLPLLLLVEFFIVV